jgi:acetyltransferase-like isoleucine patch superfamily enzyme
MIRNLLKLPAQISTLLSKIAWRIRMKMLLPLFKKCGRNVVIGHGGHFSPTHIEIGDDVYIGPYAVFNSAISTIRIGSKIMFGPRVTIMGGDHRTDVLGAYMHDISQKLPENDRDVVLEDDVWVGAGAVILKGVTIGRGSIVGAGSVVTKSIPPYSVAAGNPARVIRNRFTPEQIIEHETMLRRGNDVRI